MKKNVKAVLAAAAALTMVVGATSCSKKEAASNKVVLTVWESLSGPDEFIKQAGEAYTALHPEVEIKFVNVEIGDAAGKISLDGPAGVGADLFGAPHDKLGELVTGGHVLPTVDAASVKDSVLGACSTALTYNGTMYGYPVSAETYALFYNKAYIKDGEVPTSWADLTAWVADFNAAHKGVRGFVMDVANGYYTIAFTTANGNRLFGPAGTDSSDSYLANANSVKGMTEFQALSKVLGLPAADLTTAACDGDFAAGTAAMHITGLWNVKNFEDAGIDFGVAPLPALAGETTPAASFSGTRAMFVSAYSEHPAEAADFAKFLLTPEMQKLRFDLTGAMPSVSVEVSSKYMPGFLQQLDYAFPMPSIPEMGTFWETMGAASSNIWDGADIQAELTAVNNAIIGK